MACIYRRGRTWWINYSDNGRIVQQSLKTTDATIARYKKGQVEQALAERQKPPQFRPIPIQQALEDYLTLAQTTQTNKTFKNNRSRLLRFLDSLTVRNLHEITALHIQYYLTKRIKGDGLRHKTANHILTVIRAFLNFCVKHDYLHRNPTMNISRYKIPKIPGRYLTEEEIHRLLTMAQEYSHGQFSPMLATAIYAGLRLGELFALTWDDVDFRRKLLMVRDKPELGLRTKTGRFRVVPMHTQLATILASVKQTEGFCFFPTKTLRQTTSQFHRKFKNLLQVAQLGEIDWLVLRRTFGSQLAQKGVSLLDLLRSCHVCSILSPHEEGSRCYGLPRWCATRGSCTG